MNQAEIYKKIKENFAPFGEKQCEGICDRKVLMSPKGPIIVCNGCKRIVIDVD